MFLSISNTLSFSQVKNTVPKIPLIIPAAIPLPSLKTNEGFSILSWNILLPNSKDNWWCEKMYQQHVPMKERHWPHRQHLMQEYLLRTDADIVCIQEASGESFVEDFSFMHSCGYESVLHKKYRFRCATFYKPNKFEIDSIAHRDRSLILSLLVKEAHSVEGSAQKRNQMLYIANCHLSGGAAPDRRLRQVFDVTEQFRKWRQVPLDNLRSATMAKKRDDNRIAKAEMEVNLAMNAALIVAGDFNSDGDTAVRRLLVEGTVSPEFREQLYPKTQLTTIRRNQRLNNFLDAAEVAYQANVCDGDYGDFGMRKGYREYEYRRPATYIVPSLSSLFLIPPIESTRSSDLINSSSNHLNENFETNDETRLDRSIEMVLRDVKGQTLVEKIPETLVSALESSTLELEAAAAVIACDDEECSLDEFMEALGKEEKSKSKKSSSSKDISQNSSKLSNKNTSKKESVTGQELVSVATEEDLARVISRFTPQFLSMLDTLFDSLIDTVVTVIDKQEKRLEGEGKDLKAISELKLNEWLLSVNQVEGRGGMYKRAVTIFDQKSDTIGGVRQLTRGEFYSLFAYELSEGKWWQVAYDLTMSGLDVRTLEYDDSLQDTTREVALGEEGKGRRPRRHYEGWLDYIYYSDRVQLDTIQATMTKEQAERVYRDGDALPNSWWPSDHLPVAAVFRWLN